MFALDTSTKEIIAGPITIGDDEPVTKYEAKSDGRTFWAYNGMEVFYEDERLYSALDRIVELEARLLIEAEAQRALRESITELEYKCKEINADLSVVRLQRDAERKYSKTLSQQIKEMSHE